MQLASSTILSAVFFILSGYLSVHYFKVQESASFIKLLIIYVFLSTIFITMKGLFQGYRKMLLLSSTEFTKNLIVLLFIILFIKLGYGVLSPVLAYVLVFPVLFMLYFPAALKIFNILKYKTIGHAAMSKKLLLFAAPVLATGMGNKIIGYLDTFVLTYFRDLSEVGIYNIILPSALIFLFFGTAIASILFPLTSELWAKKDTKRLAEGLRLLYRYAFFFTIPFLFTIIIFSRVIISFFFGKEYVDGTIALQILLVGTLFSVVGTINYNFLSGIGNPQVVTKITLLAALANAILNIILIPHYGMNGAALTTAASYLLMLIVSTAKVRDYIAVKLPIREWTGLLFATFCFAVVAIAVKDFLGLAPWLEIAISFLSSTTIYFIVSYLLRIIDIEELRYYIRLALR